MLLPNLLTLTHKPCAVKVVIFPQRENTSQCDCYDCDCDCDCDCDWVYLSSDARQHTATDITTAYIELTSSCNNRCVGCSNVFITDKSARKMKGNTSVSISEWRKILGKLVPHIDHVNITGGEPTQYRHFAEFIRLIDNASLTFTLFTNARWQHPPEIVETFRQARNLSGLLISMHGKDAETHEAFTQVQGSYDEAKENIELAIRNDIRVTLSCIITRHNCDQISEIYQQSQEMGALRLVFNRYVGQPGDNCAPTSAQLRQALSEIETLRVSGASVKVSGVVPQCFCTTSATGCGAGKTFITVDPTGNVRPCNHAPLILGNLRYDSLESIMKSEAIDKWHHFVPQTCPGCSAYSVCGGGCKAEAMINHASCDSLKKAPFLPEHQTTFMRLPETLRPVAKGDFLHDDFFKEADCQTLNMLSETLDGNATLKKIGIRYGQQMLDLLGMLHGEGVVEFI